MADELYSDVQRAQDARDVAATKFTKKYPNAAPNTKVEPADWASFNNDVSNYVNALVKNSSELLSDIPRQTDEGVGVQSIIAKGLSRFTPQLGPLERDEEMETFLPSDKAIDRYRAKYPGAATVGDIGSLAIGLSNPFSNSTLGIPFVLGGKAIGAVKPAAKYVADIFKRK